MLVVMGGGMGCDKGLMVGVSGLEPKRGSLELKGEPQCDELLLEGRSEWLGEPQLDEPA